VQLFGVRTFHNSFLALISKTFQNQVQIFVVIVGLESKREFAL